jgi:hypothetical protein
MIKVDGRTPITAMTGNRVRFRIEYGAYRILIEERGFRQKDKRKGKREELSTGLD